MVVKSKKDEKDDVYFNFINTLNSELTKKKYTYYLEQFLQYCKLDLDKFLKLPQDKIADLIIKYLVQKKVSRSSKKVIFATIKHACEINDVILNWRKIKRFIGSDKTGNEIIGRDRGYELEEIRQILSFADQRLKAAFLILCSTGMRIGALGPLMIGDLQRIDDLYKITVYSGDKEQYITFTTPEAAKEIDIYLDFRSRRGEKLTQDSYVIIKRFSKYLNNFKGKPFTGESLRHLLQHTIENAGLRQIDHERMYKRKEIPLLHGIRKFFTKQLVDSKVNPEIREMLLGHKIGLTGVYYRPTVQDMLNEYLKAVPLLTISNEERLKFKLEQRITIERTQLETLRADFDKFKKDVMNRRK